MMLHSINDLSFNVIYNKEDLSEKTPVLFLHGFTGSSDDWNFFVEKLPSQYTPICVDLIGHGKSSSPADVEKYGSDFQLDLLNKLIDQLNLKKLILVGYSMGGRLALSFTSKYPQKIAALILESTSFGLESKILIKERIKNDSILAEKIKNSTIPQFIDYWLNIPLFDSLSKLPSEKIEELKRTKIEKNNSLGLSNSLIGFSTGKMKNYFTELKNFNTKVLLIVGRLDEKFTLINSKADTILPNSELKVVEECGHNVHFENPEEFLKLLNSFLLNI